MNIFLKKIEIPHNSLPAGDALRAPDGVGGRCAGKSDLRGKKIFFAAYADLTQIIWSRFASRPLPPRTIGDSRRRRGRRCCQCKRTEIAKHSSPDF